MSDLSSFAQLAAQAARSIQADADAILAQPPAPAPKSWRASLDEAARAMAAQRAKDDAAEAAKMQAQLDALTPDLKTVLEYLGIDAQPAHGQVTLDNIRITMRAKLFPTTRPTAALDISHVRPAQWDQDDDQYDAYEGSENLYGRAEFQLDQDKVTENRAYIADIIEHLETAFQYETERRAKLAERRAKANQSPAPKQFQVFKYDLYRHDEMEHLLNNGWEVVSMSFAMVQSDLVGLVILRNTRDQS